MYKKQCHKYNKLLKKHKKCLVKSLIIYKVSNKKKLFQIISQFLSSPSFSQPLNRNIATEKAS